MAFWPPWPLTWPRGQALDLWESSSPSHDSSQLFCPSKIPVQPRRCSKHSSTAFPGGRPLCHHVCLNNKYQWINTIKRHKPHSCRNIRGAPPSSAVKIPVFAVKSSPWVFIWFINTKLLECTDIWFQLVSYLVPKQHQISFLLAGQACCSVTVMWIHTINKRNTNTYACARQLLLHHPQTKVSEFRGHLVHGSNTVAGCIHVFHKDFCHSLLKSGQARNDFLSTLKQGLVTFALCARLIHSSSPHSSPNNLPEKMFWRVHLACVYS